MSDGDGWVGLEVYDQTHIFEVEVVGMIESRIFFINVLWVWVGRVRSREGQVGSEHNYIA